MLDAFLGIDVGTGSARAGIFDGNGRILASAKQDIAIWRDANGVAEQSSQNIWEALCTSVRAAVRNAGIEPCQIRGIGVDATCSLVVVDPTGAPLAVGTSGDPARNIIVWMDHRAIDQTRRINATKHPVLDYVGGQISVEMQSPKLLWLKEVLPESFAGAGHFFDLSDYLTWRLTGDSARSACTVTCKWTYLAHEKRWDPSYFETIGLGALADTFERIGTHIVDPSTPLGDGLCRRAANDLGLVEGTPVGAALIDAHAGGVGTAGARGMPAPESTLAYILGTSACAMATSRDQIFVSGVWGPYFSAMVPGMWLNEAGQSAAGSAVDMVVEMHPAAQEAKAKAAMQAMGLIDWLAQCAAATKPNLSDVALRARSLNVVPDFNGNRSPFGDPGATGIISGLSLDRTLNGLIDLYVATVCGLSYGFRQIVSALKQKGIPIEHIVVSGGGAQSPLVRQILSDATGHVVAVPESPESVLLGAAMLGAVASRHHPTLEAAMGAMSRIATFCRPVRGHIEEFHEMKATAYSTLQGVERLIRSGTLPKTEELNIPSHKGEERGQ